jgi:hypothetical protein
MTSRRALLAGLITLLAGPLSVKAQEQGESSTWAYFPPGCTPHHRCRCQGIFSL